MPLLAANLQGMTLPVPG